MATLPTAITAPTGPTRPTTPTVTGIANPNTAPLQAEFLSGAPAPGSPWAHVPGLTLPTGSAGSDLATWVGLRRHGQPLLRLDVDTSAGHSCFREIGCLGDTVFIGVGESLFVLHATSGAVQHWPMDGYFGSLYLCHDLPGLGSGVLVASATALLRLGANGQALWHTQALGWDGVLVHYVSQGVIHGSGECDPPGGWVDFRLDVNTGQPLAEVVAR